MNFEDIAVSNLKQTDSVVISFRGFNGLYEIRTMDIKRHQEILKAIGRHNGHAVTLEDDSEGQFLTYCASRGINQSKETSCR
jgi:hypothetical protein